MCRHARKKDPPFWHQSSEFTRRFEQDRNNLAVMLTCDMYKHKSSNNPSFVAHMICTWCLSWPFNSQYWKMYWDFYAEPSEHRTNPHMESNMFLDWCTVSPVLLVGVFTEGSFLSIWTFSCPEAAPPKCCEIDLGHAFALALQSVHWALQSPLQAGSTTQKKHLVFQWDISSNKATAYKMVHSISCCR